MQGGVQGQVRSWVDWPEAGLLLLNMRGNRWCGNVGRAHKSNGIFYVVDLQACGDPTDAVALPAYQLCCLVLTTDAGIVLPFPALACRMSTRQWDRAACSSP
jgi:hypothetical protein